MEIKYRRPFDGDYPVSFSFGQAPDWYIQNAGYPHNGADFPLPDGTAIRAIDNGVVIEFGNTPSGWGLYVRIEHKWGISHYAHLSKIVVKQGQTVGTSELLGFSGHSGWSIGPHLHFGVKINGHQDREMHDWADPVIGFVPAEVMEGQPLKMYSGDTVIKCPNCGTCFAIEKGV